MEKWKELANCPNCNASLYSSFANKSETLVKMSCEQCGYSETMPAFE